MYFHNVLHSFSFIHWIPTIWQNYLVLDLPAFHNCSSQWLRISAPLPVPPSLSLSLSLYTHTHTHTHTPLLILFLWRILTDVEAIWLTWAGSVIWCDLHFRNHCYFREWELSLGSERKAGRPAGRLSWSCRCDLTVAWQWLEVTGFEKYFAGFSDSSDEVCGRNR